MQRTSHDENVSSEKRDLALEVIENDHPDVALATILKTTPVKTWSRGALHLYAICLLIYLCSTMNGVLDLTQDVALCW